MFIAKQLKEKNIAEYLLYMWQVEDLLRANDLDIDKVQRNIISAYQPDDKQKAELTEWYENLMEMMRRENVTEEEHLQINKNTLSLLTELHLRLLGSSMVPFYGAAYYKALPYIVELRAKGGKEEHSDIETCFDALYGVMLLRLQKKEISEGTEKALKEISSFISLLANYYEKERNGELDEILND